MRNSIAAGRRLAARIVLAQAVAVVLVALAFLLQGPRAGLAALASGLLVMFGTALMAVGVFAPGVAGGGVALARLAAGLLSKWIVVLGGFYLILAHWGLPALPALAGFGVALLINVLALSFKD